MSSALSDAIELSRRRTLAQLRRCFYGQHRVGVISALGLREATRYGAALQEEAWHDAPVLHGDRLGLTFEVGTTAAVLAWPKMWPLPSSGFLRR